MTTAFPSWELREEMRLFLERPLTGDPEAWPYLVQGWQIWDTSSNFSNAGTVADIINQS